jgi:hypothetical protein
VSQTTRAITQFSHPEFDFFFEKSLPIMQEHIQVHLYLDNDKTGNKRTPHALSLNADKFKDERRLYQKYDDLNDWLINICKSQKQQCKPRL